MNPFTSRTSVGMNTAPSPAITARTMKSVSAVARPRRLTPCAWNHSTAGFSARARKIAMMIQTRTWRAIQMISSRSATEIAIPSTARTVVARKRTRRSSTPAGLRRRRTARALHDPLLPLEAAVLLDRAVEVLDELRAANRDAAGSIGQLVAPFLLAVFRIPVDRGLSEPMPRNTDEVEPEVFDLPLRIFVIGEQVARHRDLRI